MTDLTVENLVTCFNLKERRRLAKVAHTGVYEWVMDQDGNFFQATFADTCIRMTLMDDRDVVFHVDFDSVREATLVSGSLLELHSS